MCLNIFFNSILSIFTNASRIFFYRVFIALFFLIFLLISFSYANNPCNQTGGCLLAFNSSTIWDVPPGLIQLDHILVVGGGGGGGANTGFNNAGGGAGGAGGLVFEVNWSIESSTTQSIIIGEGGAGVDQEGLAADNGGDTTAFNITGLGGGGGILTSASNNQKANDGGSGGGGRDNNRAFALQPTSIWGGFGNDGARNFNDLGGAGGGGAGTQPPDINDDDGGPGGEGLNEVTISGQRYNFAQLFGTIYGEIIGGEAWFAGGGGGGGRAGAIGVGGFGGGGNGSSQRDLIVPTNGLPNTGGGGGGGSSAHAGADGGSGIVMIRFQDPPSNFTILQQPSAFFLNETFSTAPQIQLQTFFVGLNASGVDVQVELIGGSFEPSSTLNATTNSQGIAEFTNLNITTAGDYTLNFSVIGREDVWIESNPFTVIDEINGINILEQPGNSPNNVPILPFPQVEITGLLGDPISGVEVLAVLNSSSFTGSSTTSALTNSSGIVVFDNLQINDLGFYEIEFITVIDPSFNITSNSFEIFDSQPPTLEITRPINNAIYYSNEIEINFDATSLNAIDELFYFNWVDNITYTNPVNITLSPGDYEFIFYARDIFGLLSQEVVEFEIRELPEIIITNPINNTRFIYEDTFDIVWEFNSLYTEDLACTIFVNSNPIETVPCSQTSSNSFEFNALGLTTSEFEIIIQAELPSVSIPQFLNSSPITVTGIRRVHLVARKSFESLGDTMYQTTIEVENKVENQDIQVSIFEFIDESININPSSFSPDFTSFIDILGSLFSGELFIVDIPLTSSQSEDLITNSIAGVNENSTLATQFIVGIG